MNKKIIAFLIAATLATSAFAPFCTAVDEPAVTSDEYVITVTPENTVNTSNGTPASADTATEQSSTDATADVTGVTLPLPLTDTASAETTATATYVGKKYEIPELEMSLTIPSRYFVICTSTTQAELDASGLDDVSASLWIENLLDGNAYLEAVDFSNADGGIFAQLSPEASPDSTLYVSFYPYEETEKSFEYSEKDSRLDWITKFYLESDTSAALAQSGIVYSDMGRCTVNGKEWQKLKYEAGDTLGISYVTSYNGGELAVMTYLPASVTQTSLYEAELAEIMESVSLNEATPINYTPIIVAVSLAAAVALLIFLVKKH